MHRTSRPSSEESLWPLSLCKALVDLIWSFCAEQAFRCLSVTKTVSVGFPVQTHIR